MSVFLSYFCSIQMFFFYLSFILYSYFYCTPCIWDLITSTFLIYTLLIPFCVLFLFYSIFTLVSFLISCIRLGVVSVLFFNVNVVYICRSEMDRALPKEKANTILAVFYLPDLLIRLAFCSLCRPSIHPPKSSSYTAVFAL